MRLRVIIAMPPTTNNAYTNGRGHGKRTLTTEARAYKQVAALIARNAAANAGWRYVEGQRLAVRIDLHFPDRRRCDIANREKLAIDALADALGFDDTVIDELMIVRGACDKSSPRCEVELRAI